MPISLDSYIGVHAEALKLRSQRTEVLATNLANADTPGFRARDIDFKSALAAAGGSPDGGVRLTTTNPGHMDPAATGGAIDGNPNLKYRQPLAPALDGNTVDVQMEQAAFAENAIRYQSTLTLIGAKFRGLMTAITGQ